MNRYILILILTIGTLFPAANASELYDKLLALNGVISIEEIPAGLFSERYVVNFEQSIDHSNPARGRFEQRVVIGHVGADRPVVFVTEGYGIDRAYGPRYREELSSRLGANQIFVEHRYFGESTPAAQPSSGWDYLTAENAAADLHALREALRDIYPSKWIATGVSKGGQNALIYRAIYPKDVDVTVAYVAPVCYAVEDDRFAGFFKKVGTQQERAAVVEYQREVLRRREHLVPMLKEYVAAKELTFQRPLDEIFDYCVLEYEFSFWQMGTAASFIPSSDSPHEELFNHLMDVSPARYFTYQSEPSFFVQALRELGYYGYNTELLDDLLHIKSTKGYVSRMMLPTTAQKVQFSDALAQKVVSYYRDADPRLICIYGENDPWSSVALDTSLFVGKHNMKMVVEPSGSHRTRIKTLPEKLQNSVWKGIEGWIFGI